MHRWWERVLHHFVPVHANDYRPHLLRTSWLIFFVALTLLVEGLFVTTLTHRSARDPFFAAVVTSDVISFTNIERQNQRLVAVVENKKLSAAAQAKAEDMARRGYFSHRGPDGAQPWVWVEKAGYAYQYAGENLAVQFVDSTDVVNAWMASPTHRANIVKTTYTEVGVGVAEGMYQGRLVTFVVQFFATPRVASVSVPTPIVVVEPPAPSTAPQVAGAAVELPAPTPEDISAPAPPTSLTLSVPPAPSASVRDTFFTFVAHLVTQPRAVTNALLGSMLALVLLVVLLTVVVHIHIQQGKLIAGGVLVAAIVFVCLAANSTLLTSSVATEEAASTAFVLPAFNLW